METRTDTAAAAPTPAAAPAPAATPVPVEANKPEEKAVKPEPAPAVVVQASPSIELTRQQVLDGILLDMARKGQPEQIEQVLGLSANITACDENGMTALHLALIEGHKETVKLLLIKAVSLFDTVNVKTNLTGLQTLASQGRCEMLSWLLELHSRKEILKSIEIDFEQLFKLANPEAKKILANLQMFKACKQGDMAALKSALDKGADINAKAANGDTALHLAVEYSHYDLITFLIRHRSIDLNIENSNHCKPRDIANEKKDQAAIHLFANQALLLAVKANNLQGTQNALQDGAKICEAKNLKNAGVLHIAAHKGYAAVLELLIQHSESQDFMAKDNSKQIPLHKAFRSDNPSVIKLLLQQHAKYMLGIDEADVEGKNPVDLCSSKAVAQAMLIKFGGYKYAKKSKMQFSIFASNVQTETRMPEIHSSQMLQPGSSS